MHRLIAGLILLLAGLSPALAQRVVPPADTINCAFNTSPSVVTTGQLVRVQCDSNGRLIMSPATAGTENVTIVGPTTGGAFPIAATPITASATGTTAATTATLAAAAAKTTYICGFVITANATALSVAGVATITGTISGTLSFLQSVLAATVGDSVLQQTFTPCVPGSAVNTAIAVNSAAAGTGGNTIVSTWGYQQ